MVTKTVEDVDHLNEAETATTYQNTATPTSLRCYDDNGNLTEIEPRSPFDLDGDGTIGYADFALFDACRTGPTVPVDASSTCAAADFDGDGDVDVADFAKIQPYVWGQTWSPPVTVVQYDYRNQMVRYDPDDSVTTDAVTTYAYDALGRRIAKVLDADGTPAATLYVHFGDRVIEEQDDTGNTVAGYTHGNYIDEVLTMRRYSGATSTDYYFHTDDMYNVVAVTDATGNVVERYEYNDYGQPTITDASGTPRVDAEGRPQSAIDNPYLFNGRRYDAETGWYWYRTRYYEPTTGRFTTRDTIGLWGDPNNLGNPYAYIGNNPWSRLDPMGEGWWQRTEEVAVGTAQGGWDFASGIVVGTYNVVRHPNRTGEALGEAAYTTYTNFRKDGSGVVGAVYHTAASGGVTALGGSGLLNGYEAAQKGDYQGAARGFTNGLADAATVALGACKTKDLAKASKAKKLAQAQPGTAAATNASATAGKLAATTAQSVVDKLRRYLLAPDHPVGGSKAKWFREALGFSQDNLDDLARQIKFDPKQAVQTAVTEHGTKFNQVIEITGANGKKIPVTFAWIKNTDGVVRLVTAIPTSK